MLSYFKKVPLSTKKQFELVPITDHLRHAVGESGVKSGLVTVYVPHTTAGVRINHQEALLAQDIMKALYRLIPMEISYSHDLFELRQSADASERSNGHAHVKSFLLGSSEQLIIENGQVMLGAKQSLFFVELDGGRNREVYFKIIGE